MNETIRRQDVTGRPIKVGDLVRIVGVPDLSGMSADCRLESLPIFRYLVGKYKRIQEFDEFGHAWLNFKIRKGPHAGFHWVAIEPCLLRVRIARR